MKQKSVFPYRAGSILPKNFYWVLWCLVFHTQNLSLAQELGTLENKGEKALNQKEFSKAFGYFQLALEQNPDNTDAMYKLAICYLNTSAPQKGLNILIALQKETISKSIAYKYYLAEAYFQTEQFDKSLQLVDELKNYDSPRFSLTGLKRKIIRAKEHYESPRHYLIQNLGPKINTAQREYSPIMSYDHESIMFTTRRSHEKYNILAEDGHVYEKIYATKVDEKNGEWINPKLVHTGAEGTNHSATVQLLENDKKMIIYHDGDLYLSKEKNFYHWKKGKALNQVNRPYSVETHCFMTDDEETIYFSSNYNSEHSDLDLYVIKKNIFGEWTRPKPLTNLNTPFDEDAPFLDQEGNIYFSSEGHNSLGGFDIYKATLDEKTGEFSKPENLGYPINSVSDDIYYSTFGKIAYFASSRTGGYGSLDIYKAYLFDRVKLEGEIIDQTGNPVIAVNFRVDHGENVYQGVSDLQGKYEIYVPFEEHLEVSIIQKDSTILNKDYVVRISFSDFNKNDFDFFIDVNDHNDQNIPTGTIQKVHKKTEVIKIKAFNDLEYNPILSQSRHDEDITVIEKRIARMEEALGIIGKPEELLAPTLVNDRYDKVYFSEKKKKKNSHYSILEYMTNVDDEMLIAEEDGYYLKAIEPEITTEVYIEDAEDDSLEIIFGKERVVKVFDLFEEGYQVDKTIQQSFETLFFEDNSHSIKSEHIKELEKAADFLKKHPNLQLEVVGHSDNLGDFEQNYFLSQKRAELVASFLKQKGITSERLIIKGMGASYPLVSNDDEDIKQLNRRVELKVIQ